MTSSKDPLDVLGAALAMLVHDYGQSRELALTFWRRGGLDYDDVNGVWRDYWDRGLHDED